jgi:dihydroneopterin aldolase/2-amino-4-hydroxy-6-hydroxymethyldihydropteridine diphosphokinase/dihydropteroate synthase
MSDLCSSYSPDAIVIRDLRAQATVGPDLWGKVRPQPITLSVSVEASLVASGKSDDVSDTINYGSLGKDITKTIDNQTFDSLYALAKSVLSLVMARDGRITAVDVTADAGNQFLQAQSLGVQIRETREGSRLIHDRTLVKELAVSTIIGVNPPEREAKQVVLVNLTFYSFDWDKANWKETHTTLVEVRFISQRRCSYS